MELNITATPTPADDAVITDGVRRYNRQFVPATSEPLSVYLRNPEQQIIAGLTGKTSGGWLYISFLWVDDSVRGQSLGSQVLQAAENEARLRGCHSATLDTFSFQAPDFYRKHGYTVWGTLAPCAGNHQRYYLQKALTSPAGCTSPADKA